jgi:hypothetical protein
VAADTDAAWRLPPRLLAWGIALAVAAALQPVLAWAVEPSWGWGLAATMGAELLSGREVSAPLALSQGVPPAWIALTSVLQNLALAAIGVPLAMAVLGKGETATGRFGRLLGRLHALAAHQRHRGASAWALFLFMLVPFLPNGAVLAGLIGTLTGIGARLLVFTVTVGVLVTATAWSFGYALLAGFLDGVDPRLARVPAILALVFTVFAVARLAILLRRQSPAA